MNAPTLAIHDLKGLSELSSQAKKDSDKALPEAARQFEAMFMQTLLKTMRTSHSVLSEDSPFRSYAQDTFQEMLDGQYAMEMSKNDGVGLAKMLAKQLSRTSNPEANQEIKALDSSHSVTKKNQSTENIADHVLNFVDKLKPYAEQAASILGVDAKILIAQSALETGWGMFTAKGETGENSNNLFNIKAKNSDKNAIKIKTTEFLADKPIKMNQYFKRYDSMEDSFRDFVQLIQGSERYQQALDHHGNSEQFIQRLQKAGYATDPNYADKILTIYRNPNLQAAMEFVASKMPQGDNR